MADTIPAAPSHLPEAIQAKWRNAYTKALAQAKIDHPEDEARQRTVAAKEANKLLRVPAPESADDIDALEPWQVLHRGARTKGGTTEKFCVTADGRKYAFPVVEKSAKSGKGKGKDADSKGSEGAKGKDADNQQGGDKGSETK